MLLALPQGFEPHSTSWTNSWTIGILAELKKILTLEKYHKWNNEPGNASGRKQHQRKALASILCWPSRVPGWSVIAWNQRLDQTDHWSDLLVLSNTNPLPFFPKPTSISGLEHIWMDGQSHGCIRLSRVYHFVFEPQKICYLKGGKFSGSEMHVFGWCVSQSCLPSSIIESWHMFPLPPAPEKLWDNLLPVEEARELSSRWRSRIWFQI